jgi:hypothetical protein
VEYIVPCLVGFTEYCLLGFVIVGILEMIVGNRLRWPWWAKGVFAVIGLMCLLLEWHYGPPTAPEYPTVEEQYDADQFE